MKILYSQILSIFTTRELALFTWLIIFLVICFLNKDVRTSIFSLIKCAFAPIFVKIFLVLLTYLIIITIALSKVDLWNMSLIKSTIYWFVFSGLGMCLSNIKDKNFSESIKQIIFDNFKIVVVLELVISNYTFNYWVEFIVAFVMFIIITMNVFTDKKDEFKEVKAFTDGLLSIIGFVVLLLFVYFIKVHYKEIFSTNSVREILLPFLYALFFIAPAYLIKAFSEYEMAFIRLLHNKNYDKKMSMFLKYKVLSLCKSNFKMLNHLVVDFNLLTEMPRTEEDFDNFVNVFLEREKIIPFSPDCLGFNPVEAKSYLSDEGLEAEDYKYVDFDEGFGNYYGSSLKSFGLADTLNYTLEGNNQEVERLRLIFGEFLPKGQQSVNYKYFIKCTEYLYLKALKQEMPQKLLLTLMKRKTTRHSLSCYLILLNKQVLNKNLTHYEFSIQIKK